MKGLFEAVARVAMDEINAEDQGYEMGCLISAEFTPSPSYTGVLRTVVRMLKERGATFAEFYEWLGSVTDIEATCSPHYPRTVYNYVMDILLFAAQHDEVELE